MEGLLHDLRFAARRLSRSPGFTAIAIASLALGIGANTSIFSVVDAVLLRKPAFTHAEQLTEVYFHLPEFNFAPFSYADYRDIRDATGDVFQGMSASKFSLAPRDLGDRIVSVPVELVSDNYFSLLGLAPRMGRFLDPAGADRGANPVVILSYDYWQREFSGDPGVLGTELRISGRPYTVIGIAPQDYKGNLRGLDPSMYLPISMINDIEPSGTDQLQDRGSQAIFVKGRLRPGVGLVQAQAAVARVADDLKTRFPLLWTARTGITLVATNSVILNPSIDRIIVPAAALLMVVVGLVLLIACANLASFLLAQAADRRKEIAIRLALGARRSRLVRQLLTETVALGIAGGVFGVLLSLWFLRLISTADLPLPLPVTLDLTMDRRVLGFAFLVSVVSGVLFGFAPAIQSARSSVASTLRDETAGGGRPRRLSLRNVLVVGQVAASLVLLVAAGLFLRSFQARQNVDPGFGHQPAAIVNYGLPANRYDQAAGDLFNRRFAERVAQLPGVAAVGLAGNIPLNPLNTQWMDVNIPGRAPPPGEQAYQIDWAPVDPGFFAAIGIELVRGRDFGPEDRVDAPAVAIINQTMATQFWPGSDPIGQVFHTDDGDVRVVGVTRDTKVRTVGEPPRSFVFRPLSQRYSSELFLVARTRGGAEGTTAPILEALRQLDPDIPVFQSMTLARHLEAMLLPARLGALAFTAFAALALSLALIGLYGVVSYAVARRTREMGIRISLGAETRQVVGMLLGHGMQLALVGSGIGLVAALLVGRLMQSMLFGVTGFDPITFGGVVLLMLGVAAFAAFLPARRAARISPVRALKSE